jgi:hypothetical protein
MELLGRVGSLVIDLQPEVLAGWMDHMLATIGSKHRDYATMSELRDLVISLTEFHDIIKLIADKEAERLKKEEEAANAQEQKGTEGEDTTPGPGAGRGGGAGRRRGPSTH